MRTSVFAFCLLTGVTSLGLVANAADTDWPRWRGANGDGISTATDWNVAAVDKPNVLWRGNVGAGYSAASVKGERLYIMGHREKQDVVSCLKTTDGTEVWKHSYDCQPAQYPGPRATPVIDGDVVYTVSNQGHVFCLDAKTGTVKWQQDLTKAMKAELPQWGIAGSAVVHGKMLLINAGAYGVALDKATGNLVWSSGAGKGGYASPVVFKAGDTDVAAVFGQKAIYGVNAETGEKLWSYPWETSWDVNAPDPVISDGQVFITSGYGKGCALLKIAAGQAKPVWQNTALAAHFSSPVLIDGYLYGMDGNTGRGGLVCLDVKNGDVKWKQALGFGSLIAVAGKLIVLTETGDLFVAAAKPDAYQQLAAAKGVIGRTCWTSPVLAHGQLYLRNEKGDLVCLDVKK